MKVWKILVLLIPLAFFISACNSDSNKKTTIISENESVVVVNNKKILLSQFQFRFAKFGHQYKSLIPEGEKYTHLLKELVINHMIEEELMIQEASRRGVVLTVQESDAVATRILSPYPGAKMTKYLQQVKLSQKNWKEGLQRYLLFQKLIKKEVIDKIAVTKLEIRDYYRKNKKQYVIPKRYKVRHIVVASYDDALTIYTQIKKRRVGFLKMIKHSISPDRGIDGDLGYITAGELPTELESAIFAMKRLYRVGSIVHTPHGYHIFRVEKIRRRKRISFDSARTKIKRILIEKKQDTAFQTWMTNLKSRANITIDRTTLFSDEGF